MAGRMYNRHYNFDEAPFSIAPDPRYLFLTQQHREALAHLLYGIGTGGGFVVLTGEVGTGKTTLCRCLLEQLPNDVDVALIFNPRLDSRELLETICDELRVEHPGPGASLKQLIDRLNHYLLASHAGGRRTIVLIDEAQNLSFDVLEQIRLLTNLETNRAKLLQIILVGQPELNELLERADLRQLAQRVTARYHLRPLSRLETADYIAHRLAVTGVQRPLFTPTAIRIIHRRAGGIPRRINILCDRALLGAYGRGRHQVDGWIARGAVLELRPPRKQRRRLRRAIGLGLAAAAVGGMVLTLKPDGTPPTGSTNRLTGPADRPEDGKASPRTLAPPTLGGILSGLFPATADGARSAAGLDGVAGALPGLLARRGYDREAGLMQLQALWQLPPVADPCSSLDGQGLRCLTMRGSFQQLRRMNLPALLEFILPSGAKRFAVLQSLKGEQVTLALRDGTEPFTLGDILPYWSGEAVVLFRPPPGSEWPLAKGVQSEAVKWIRDRLKAPAGSGPATLFDAALKARVLAFQVEQGLSADGVVGPQTLILLDAKSADDSIPRLEPIRP